MPVADVRELVPLPQSAQKTRESALRQLSDILIGADKRKIIIAGPCSADSEDAVCDYACRLSRVAESIRDRAFVIVRVYTAKPRTHGSGYKGMYYNPDPVADRADIENGIVALRKMHVRVLCESGLITADEMLFPQITRYIDDVLGYAAVGARSSDDQFHKLVASGLDIPIGIKNPLNGDLRALAGSLRTAQSANEFMFCGSQVATSGNAFAHAVLRGGVDSAGRHFSNSETGDILRLKDELSESGIVNPSAIVDVNHSNSGKDPFVQPDIMYKVLRGLRSAPEANELVKGFMTESYIEDGKCAPDVGVYGKSITDACLGFEKTKQMLLRAADEIVA